MEDKRQISLTHPSLLQPYTQVGKLEQTQAFLWVLFRYRYCRLLHYHLSWCAYFWHAWYVKKESKYSFWSRVQNPAKQLRQRVFWVPFTENFFCKTFHLTCLARFCISLWFSVYFAINECQIYFCMILIKFFMKTQKRI